MVCTSQLKQNRQRLVVILSERKEETLKIQSSVEWSLVMVHQVSYLVPA